MANASNLIAILHLFLYHLSAKIIGLKLSIKPYYPNKLGNIHTLNPATTHIKYITNLSINNPTRKTNKYRDISQIAYFTVNGQTGNNTKAKAPATTPNIIHFLERVVSNLNEQNFELGSLGCDGYKICGYLRFFESVGLLKKINQF